MHRKVLFLPLFSNSSKESPDQMNLITEQKYIENKCMVTKGDSRQWGEMSWEFGINIYLLPSVRQANRDLPGCPVVRTPRFHCRWHRLDQGTNIPNVTQCSQKKGRNYNKK